VLGYVATNHALRDRPEPVRCNRDMQKATFEERGLAYASELAVQNVRDLRTILEWNREHGVGFYRCTSTLVPWNSQFDLDELPDYPTIADTLDAVGDLVEREGMRLTFHPDYWCRLASDTADTVERSLRAIEYHGDWFAEMGLPADPYYGVNVHLGTTYGDRAATADRFHDALDRLSPRARAHLTVENDDDPDAWAVPDLVEAVGDRVPVVFDYHHHSLADRGLGYREAFDRAARTWPCRPATHYSEPARLRDGDARPSAHAEFVSDLPDWLRERSDVMIEAGGKERALRRLREGGAPDP
jgi:UV DNA damage endonuclease